MNDNAWSTIPEVDIILFIVEATSNGIGKGDQMILEKLKESNKKEEGVSKNRYTLFLYSRTESNRYPENRNLIFYPLNYGSNYLP